MPEDNYMNYSTVFVGVSLRDPRQHSAISVVGAQIDEQPFQADRYTRWTRKTVYHVIELVQMRGQPVADILRRAALLADSHELALIEDIDLIIDVSEVGLGVANAHLDIDDRVAIVPVVLTQDRVASYSDGLYAVPRREMIAHLVDSLASHRLRVAQLPLAETLDGELAQLDMKQSAEDLDTSLVTSVGIAVWRSAFLGETADVLADGLRDDSQAPDHAEWDLWEQ